MNIICILTSTHSDFGDKIKPSSIEYVVNIAFLRHFRFTNNILLMKQKDNATIGSIRYQ